MKKYELITNLEVNPAKSKTLIDEFLNHFDEWDKYEDEFINEEKVEIKTDTYKWNATYLRKHISLLSSNFSKKRLEHIKEIIEYLYSEEETEKESVLYKKKIIWLIVLILSVITLISLSKFYQHSDQHAMKEMNQTKVKEQNTTKEINQTKVIEQNTTKKIIKKN